MTSELRWLLASSLSLLGCPGDDTGGAASTAASETQPPGSTGSAETDATGSETSAPEDGSTSSPPDTSGGESSGGGSSSGGAGSSSTAGALADTWESWALPSFFAVYCNECHPAAGVSQRDFGDYDQVGANAEHIRCGVAPEAVRGCDPAHIEPGHLPIGSGPFPSDEDRWRLVDWMDAGMPRD